MPDVVACTCGAWIRLPDGRSGHALRCPRCKAVLVAARDGEIVASALADSATQAATCPIRKSAIDLCDAVIVCLLHNQVHDKECWTTVGGGGIYSVPLVRRLALPEFSLASVHRRRLFFETVFLES